jgi:hypothetical protein
VLTVPEEQMSFVQLSDAKQSYADAVRQMAQLEDKVRRERFRGRA